ncbi:copper amine oxidase N-terminal domain-containing protein [Anaerotignum lactatifermentans]|uniref:copper amine oxidase N-terminal domain-containing protein n=1 Tax=Anaerotignum lactatifermentans TaxID=160404 RepID=UPI0027B94B64|nr:copper amine oxidase N-terminal domain-containing protein [Anaerotignum lactatifermentans]
MKQKKVLCAGLVAAMLMGLVPQTALAAENNILYYDFRTYDTDVSGDGWDWDASGRILTIDGLYVNADESNTKGREGAICLPEDSILYLDGDSEINVDGYGLHAIYAEGDLTVRGNDDLVVRTTSASSSVIYVYRGDINLEDNVFLEVYPEGHVLYVDEARGSDGVVNIYDKAKVEVHDPYDDNFYMMDTDELVKVTYRSPAKPTDEWLNFSEKYDKDYETITFYRKNVVDQPEEPEETPEEPEDKPEETPAETHVFQIKIGETYLVKDDEERIALDAPAYLSEDGYTMLPLRALLNVSKDGVQIDWNQKDKIATITYDDTTVVIPVEGTDKTVTINGEETTLVTAPQTVNDRAFLSLRDWCTVTGMSTDALQWDGATKTVTMTVEK